MGQPAQSNHPLPRWRCHKLVHAAPITSVQETGDTVTLRLDVDGQPEFRSVSRHWWHRMKPQVGGYFVVYQDGYESYSPAEAFDAGYTREGGE